MSESQKAKLREALGSLSGPLSYHPAVGFRNRGLLLDSRGRVIYMEGVTALTPKNALALALMTQAAHKLLQELGEK